MQAWYDRAFEREMGLTAADFRRCLPEAFEPFAANVDPAAQSVTAALATGTARVAWRELPPRAIALLATPRLHVRFEFGATDDAERQTVMKRFDRVMLRGGG